ncbi:hypothetical protein PISMIDRAFT_327460 [Pisolithus microcarpus 441]|uniref:Uncharacterized protein n=1 Tax=Pisolithus microcarpus 441 TaxID=765257 RepID=A0A0C9Z9C4_9AGAM|nr:hypothetical protein PISMIDRAFT_327460 [Pisolithus microcarpus 441]
MIWDLWQTVSLRCAWRGTPRATAGYLESLLFRSEVSNTPGSQQDASVWEINMLCHKCNYLYICCHTISARSSLQSRECPSGARG